eukprot:TRINITY_DN4180_c0_g1_i4.p1 TRINITY_DN4180_c0_g1~~TRINITY_DN4180_c0_g1_i4.p1  ORF type:complete len:291 (+),score=3.49 TRINITY_DN4180_c0_g1_i4:210-1082(+)
MSQAIRSATYVQKQSVARPQLGKVVCDAQDQNHNNSPTKKQDQKFLERTGHVLMQLNDMNNMMMIVPLETLLQRSKLFKQHENDWTKTQINLKLERPEKFSILLHYIMTGEMTEEMSLLEVFTAYVNDATYLGIGELEIHFLDIMEKACKEKKQDTIKFFRAAPSADFMERFMREKYLDTGGHTYEYIKLLANWIRTTETDKHTLLRFEQLPFDISSLALDQVQQLREIYPNEFDVLASAKSVASYLEKVTCRKCKKSIFRCQIGLENCYAQQYHHYYDNDIPIQGYHEQ